MYHCIKHFRTITRHRHMVIRHCRKAGIFFQGLRHDLSKYSPTEFLPGAKYYLGYKSPTEAERLENGYSLAWMHHKGRNRHHFEYWYDYNPATHLNSPVKMPLRYVKEMFCDRVAAGKIYKGKAYTDQSSLAYFINGHARTVMHPQTAALLEEWLTMLAEKGEKETFAHIKKLKGDYGKA